jgi:5'-methylthioadenosine phosphorylase
MKLGIIGGSGVYDLEGLEQVKRKELKTPFGSPSDAFVTGRLGGHEIFFLPRHGKGHRIMPSEINHRANIFGMKLMGVDRVLSISAVGSLRENIHPRDIVLPDQYFDRTKKAEEHTFFGNGIVAHVAFSDPTCPSLRRLLAQTARETVAGRPGPKPVNVIDGGTYVNMEGPAFSTRAESETYRHLGFHIIGMTSLPEAKLCREAEICYQAMSMVTDYDCWHQEEGPVNVEMVIGHLMANTSLAKEIIARLVSTLPERSDCTCSTALKNAIITDRSVITNQIRERLAPLIGKYV